VLGTYLGLHAKATYDDAITGNCSGGLSHCNQLGVDGVDSAEGQAVASTALFLTGGVLLAGGIVLFATAPRDTAVRLHAGLGTTNAGLRLGGSW
jgi:hypothetical protein